MEEQKNPGHVSATDQHGEPVVFGRFNEHEIYPMPIFAKFGVRDVAAVTAWYEKALGFKTVFAMPAVDGQPTLVHLRRKKYQDILITRAQTDGNASSSLTLNFSVDDAVDALSEQARAAAPCGNSAVNGPVDTPWNSRDLNVTDPAGHQLVFTGRRLNPDPEMSARWQAMFDQARKP